VLLKSENSTVVDSNSFEEAITVEVCVIGNRCSGGCERGYDTIEPDKLRHEMECTRGTLVWQTPQIMTIKSSLKRAIISPLCRLLERRSNV